LPTGRLRLVGSLENEIQIHLCTRHTIICGPTRQ